MITESGLIAHYTKEYNLEKILEVGKIRLGKVENMDDPRESSLGWIDTIGLGTKIDKQSWKKAEKVKRDVGKKLRIFCTAQPKSETKQGESPIESSIFGRPRMWSQYGNKFRGFCINFRKNKLIDSINSHKSDNEFVIHGPVRYPAWLHIVQGGALIEYGQGIDPEQYDIFSIINHNQMLRSIYFKKGYDWAEEREYRWLYYSEKSDDVLIEVRDSIHSVVLGNNFPNDKLEEAKKYCKDIDCYCYFLQYRHPEYKLIQMA